MARKFEELTKDWSEERKQKVEEQYRNLPYIPRSEELEPLDVYVNGVHIGKAKVIKIQSAVLESRSLPLSFETAYRCESRMDIELESPEGQMG